MSEITEAFVEAAFHGRHADVAQLVTLYVDALDEPLRVTDWSEGIVSNGEVYVYYPFELSWAGASQDDPFGAAQITIANVDRRIEEACDAALNPPIVDLMIVRVDEPDVVEKAILDARLNRSQGDQQKVTGVVRPRDFAQEPACAVSYTPATVPGLF